MNRVCAVHNEYCPDGDCRWCVAPEAEPDTAAPVMDLRYGFAMHQPSPAEQWPPGGVTGSGL